MYRKNPTASAGFEPANSGTRGQHANHQTTEAVMTTETRAVSAKGLYLLCNDITPLMFRVEMMS
jgi:hypothetical protein